MKTKWRFGSCHGSGTSKCHFLCDVLLELPINFLQVLLYEIFPSQKIDFSALMLPLKDLTYLLYTYAFYLPLSLFKMKKIKSLGNKVNVRKKPRMTEN